MYFLIAHVFPRTSNIIPGTTDSSYIYYTTYITYGGPQTHSTYIILRILHTADLRFIRYSRDHRLIPHVLHTAALSGTILNILHTADLSMPYTTHDTSFFFNTADSLINTADLLCDGSSHCWTRAAFFLNSLRYSSANYLFLNANWLLANSARAKKCDRLLFWPQFA